MKQQSTIKDFGKRLARARKTQGFTQQQLADAIGVSRRIISYYENGETPYPPAHLLKPLAETLKISLDDLMGVKISKNKKLLEKIKQIETLSKKEQKEVIKLIDNFIADKR